MKTLKPNEVELVGEWINTGTGVDGDRTCERIDWLIENVLQQIGYHKENLAWETLYRDPQDGRFWVKTYPHSERHGGGPAALICISEEKAKADFDAEKRLLGIELYKYLVSLASQLKGSGEANAAQQVLHVSEFVCGSMSELFGEAWLLLPKILQKSGGKLSELDNVRLCEMIAGIDRELRRIGGG